MVDEKKTVPWKSLQRISNRSCIRQREMSACFKRMLLSTYLYKVLHSLPSQCGLFYQRLLKLVQHKEHRGDGIPTSYGVAAAKPVSQYTSVQLGSANWVFPCVL